LAERVAVKKLLPPTGKNLIEVGAGFGRLADMYDGYEKVVLVDYARTQLEAARQYLDDDERFVFVVADVYGLPFVDNLFDSLVMVRVMHHLVAVPDALQELKRIISASGVSIIEFANKQNLKAILRWLLKRQSWSPFSIEPHEFVALNIDFHPKWIRQQFSSAGLAIQTMRTVSHFRIPILKKTISPKVLASLDGLAQTTGNWWQLSPSVFLKAIPEKEPAPSDGFFRCPRCGNHDLKKHATGLFCEPCHLLWEYRDGIYDFKTPVEKK
jgi:SAM-dependent methyltransferase